MKHFTIKAAIIAIMLFNAIALKAQTVLINENFDANANAAPAGWTNTVVPVPNTYTAAWGFNNPCSIFGSAVSAGSTAMSGNVATAVSAGCPAPSFEFDQENDATLTTPEFDASGVGTTCFLEFDNSIKHTYANMLCQVDVWNGTTWTAVFTRLATDDGPFTANHKNINITSACGNYTQAKVRFHYFGNGDLYWLIDNVKITKLNCVTPTVSFQISPVCDSGIYYVMANITSMGSTTSLSYGDNNTIYDSAITAPGIYSSTAFSNGSVNVVSLMNNADSGCKINSDAIVYNCSNPNDECSGAVLLPDPSTTCNNTAGSTLYSTVSVNNPTTTCQYDNYGDIWFKFVVTAADLNVNFSDMAVPNYNTGGTFSRLGAAVYTGTCGNLTEQSCHLGVLSPWEPIQTPDMTLSGLTIGDTCFIRVWDGGVQDATSASFLTDAYLSFNVCVTLVTPPNCVTSFSPADNSISSDNTPLLEWNQDNTATGYHVYFDQNSPPTTLYATTGVTGSYQLTNALAPGDYYWYVEPFNNVGSATGCNVNTVKYTVVPTPGNDEAPGAFWLTVDSICNNNVYTNNYGTQSASEPFPACVGGGLTGDGNNTVWYKFIAPPSGAVRISTDFSSANSTDIPNARVALFDATDSSNYGTFQVIACGYDNGPNGIGATIYSSILTPGQTYYVAVDGIASYDYSATSGTFCLTVKTLTLDMLANGDFSSGACVSAQTIPLDHYEFGSSVSYAGWFSIVDVNGRLIAEFKNPNGGLPAANSASFYVNQGAVRMDSIGEYYLDRNFKVSNIDITSPTTLPVLVKFYFKTSELNALTTATNGTATLGTLKVVKQSGDDCLPQIDTSAGAFTDLQQSLNGSTNGISWIEIGTHTFSNFYLKGGGMPLAIILADIKAINRGQNIEINWTTTHADKGQQLVLERSNDGRTFSHLADIKAKPIPSDYQFIDINPFEGINFYRLKMIDNDGTKTYSKIVSATVLNKGNSVVNVFPNPANHMLNVQVTGAENGTIDITDISGRVLYNTTMTGNALQIDMSSFTSGIYLLHYTDKNINRVIKVNKQ